MFNNGLKQLVLEVAAFASSRLHTLGHKFMSFKARGPGALIICLSRDTQ